MGNREILVDTSIIIEHLRKFKKSESTLFNIVKDYNLLISTISVFELWAGATDERKTKDIENVLLFFEILPVTSEIAKTAGKIFLSLKQENKIIETKDIFISATALVYNLPILTLNKGHFIRVENIKILDI